MEEKGSFEIQITGFDQCCEEKGMSGVLRCSECWQDRGKEVSMWAVQDQPLRLWEASLMLKSAYFRTLTSVGEGRVGQGSAEENDGG